MRSKGHPDILCPRLDLRWMSPQFIEASLVGSLHDAEAAIDASLPSWWPEAAARRRLEMRLEQMRANPSSGEWLLRAMVRGEDRTLVGFINFHGPPDERNRAELGYTVFEAYRRQGYGTEAVLGMMGWAKRVHAVETFVLSISPQNRPSLGLAAKLGFRRVGSQIDEEDGEECVFELAATDL